MGIGGYVGAGLGVAALAGGAVMAGHALMNPIDTAVGAAKAGIGLAGIAQSPNAMAAVGTAAGVGLGTVGAIGVAGFAAYKGRNAIGSFMTSAKPGGGGIIGKAASAAASAQGKIGGFPLHFGVGAGMMMFGGLIGLGEIGTSRYVSENAMMNSQTGSAYSGSNGFGSRKSGAMKSMANSTNNLVQGLHAGR